MLQKTIFLFLLITLPLSATSKPAPQEKNLCGYPLVGSVSFVRTGRKFITFKAGIADTPRKQTRGLMYCKKMGDDEALLFIFQNSRRRNFWMQDTSLDLAIIFVDIHYKVINIEHGIPYSTQQLYSQRKAIFVVEILWKHAQKIRPGDHIVIR